ncbi:short-subunit dehydrogenase [Scopulibacillus darangshiensis]|uniref:Short-subunit dehydrogenase n=1 Tax=Scopulibacillus darangshiensis TaxID=442528 RepID=A0A4R2NRI5_9BACL|nr:SDR family NAD(P)-dependent oxidoreductase [Scopulibacillus darangshiensis]TCP24549.1 short-subunit dehydrogenase [Scopulibacillus darangshiensis]
MSYIVITGGGSGLGRTLAFEYGSSGLQPILLGRNEEKLKAVQKELTDKGIETVIKTCDITDSNDIKAAAGELTATFEIDMLINNAGIGFFGPFESMTEDEIGVMIDTNIKGTIMMTQSFTPYFHKKGQGKILNIISTAGLKGKRNEAVYCATKFAVRGFSESLKSEWSEEENLSVVSAYMGGMNTPFWDETDHIENPEKLASPEAVAAYIFRHDDGRDDIHVNKEELREL